MLFNLYHPLGKFSRLMIVFFLIFLENKLLTVHSYCLLRRQVHEMTKLFSGKSKKKYLKMMSAEIFIQHALIAAVLYSYKKSIRATINPCPAE